MVGAVVGAAAVFWIMAGLLGTFGYERVEADALLADWRVAIEVVRRELTALQAQISLDNGVYPFTLGGIVAFLLGGYYTFQNLRMELREVLTNKPQCGAYRAPGAPQATFAIESSVDELAYALGMDPLELRVQNAAGPEDLTGEGEPWGDIGMRACLETALAHPLWANRHQDCGPGEGVGLAVGGWPCGNSTAGAICRVDTDGTIRVHVGSVDISGVNSSLVLIAADLLLVVTPSHAFNETLRALAPHRRRLAAMRVALAHGGARLVTPT